MIFENREIDIVDIPKVEEAILHPIDKKYRTVQIYNQLLTLLMLVFFAAALIYFAKDLQNALKISLISGGIFIFFILNFRLTYLSFLNKSFAIREHDIIYQTGWLIKRIHICPISRIQHCSINSGVFERKFNLCKIKLFTAGGTASDVTIPGLSTSEAEKIRNFILDKIKIEDEQ